ncbi:MAG: class I SAM-dependent methyltransferase [Candidatus Paracaedibacteraceae bacterium]|nr:class I SAM-dependent methyltransferase [Candidatus Paracaedibacteraceae bacterium]
MNAKYLIVLFCLFAGAENLESADKIRDENDIESVRALFPFKTLTEQQKQLALVPCKPEMHVGAYRRYWDTPMLQYFSNQIQDFDNVLEIGCAIGDLSYRLFDEKKDKVDILAIDFNESALSHALAKQKQLISSGKKQYEHIQFIHTNFGKQFFFERAHNFDHVSFFSVAHFMTPNELNTAFCNIRNCLTEKGVLYFSMVAMVASVKNDSEFMKHYTDGDIYRNVNYPGYVYGTAKDSSDMFTYTYQFAEKLKDIPFAYQNIEGKKVLFLGDKKTIKHMMNLNGLKPIHMFYSSAKKEKHFESMTDALNVASDFTLNIVAKLL